ncbi:MAG: NAD(P)/FAD-dependent oxidoreductase [Odoribacteraceae bacterium]|jgi:all-trans-retinol 13,14-reductase|nr:NAD(P)/FAD-dependent oxidoreductase [Odoribacteraceae bacterium]
MDKRVIIIGSGLGGLTCGYILAKNGYRVTLLEQNTQFGGCLQNFTRRGAKFETGMHYIGSMGEGEVLRSFFNYLALLPDVRVRALDRAAYDIISIAGERFPLANGDEPFVETLARRFPRERQHLREYVRVINEVAAGSPLHSLQYVDSMTFLELSHVKRSASEFIDATITDGLLRQVLVGNLPLYAGVKGRTPLYIHAFVNHFYNAGAYRVVGGSDVIARSLVTSIRALGGEARAGARVVKISCDATRATGVTLATGEELRCDYLVSNTHPLRTLELLDTPLIRRSYRERVAGLKNSISNFTLYLHFKKDALPYLNSNLYHYDLPDVWGAGDYDPAAWPGSFLYMHLCSSVDQRYADTAIVMAYMRFEEVARWRGTRVGRRGEEYEAFKRDRAERLLEALERQYPGTRANVEHYYASTPLTYLDYTGTEEGAMYGILRDCTEPSQGVISQRTRVPNLFQVGQNINSHGILGVIIGAIITAGELLGVNEIIKQIKRAR